MLPFPNLFLKIDNFTLLIFLFLGVLIVNILIVLGIGSFEGRAFVMTVVELAGVALLLKNGKFAYTKYARWVNAVFAVVIIGALFKTMHWPGADVILIAGLMGFPILYFVYFSIEKREASLQSLLKLVLVSIMFILPLFKIMHWPHVFELQIANDILFVLTLAVFIVPNFKLLTQKQ
jgi:uncharacterized membrane protein YjjP (DUF1212 family)